MGTSHFKSAGVGEKAGDPENRNRIKQNRRGLPEFKKPLRFGLASILGSGKQVVSWIAIDDLVRIYRDAIENENWNGVFNAVAPEPVSNKQLVLQIAEHQNISLPFHVPPFVLKAILGEMSIEVLKSTTVGAGKLQQQGFHFLYPTVKEFIQKLEAS
jgi:NAD dependent epimerase/dehydratase family enzyme